MKKAILILLISISATAIAQHEEHLKADSANQQPKPKSPHTSAMATIGRNHIHVDYSSPSVRGRQIWNGLVAYKQVWSSGAHNSTSINFSADVIVEGKSIPKGKYGFFIIPDKDQWTLILNKNWNMHLADNYNEADDIMRITAIPDKNIAFKEALTYEISETGKNMGVIEMSWEYLSVSIKFKNK